jgi:hypothetical protein
MLGEKERHHKEERDSDKKESHKREEKDDMIFGFQPIPIFSPTIKDLNVVATSLKTPVPVPTSSSVSKTSMTIDTHINSTPEMRKQEDSDNRKTEFMKKLHDKRVEQQDVIKDGLELRAEILKLVDSKKSSFEMFQAEAEVHYPELKGHSAAATAEKLPDSHPLRQLWANYRPNIASLNHDIHEKAQEYQQLYSKEQSIMADIVSTMKDYNEHREGLPSAETLAKQFEQQNIIPVVDESSVVADATSLDLVDTDAQGLISATEAAQAVDMQTKPDLKKIAKYGAIAAIAYSILS